MAKYSAWRRPLTLLLRAATGYALPSNPDARPSWGRPRSPGRPVATPGNNTGTGLGVPVPGLLTIGRMWTWLTR
jgi:hypothetical protein